MINITEEEIQAKLRLNPDPKFHQLIYEAYGVRMSVSNINADELTMAANESECSKLSYIKEMVRLFNSCEGDTRLTLITDTTEFYTGVEEA